MHLERRFTCAHARDRANTSRTRPIGGVAPRERRHRLGARAARVVRLPVGRGPLRVVAAPGDHHRRVLAEPLEQLVRAGWTSSSLATTPGTAAARFTVPRRAAAVVPSRRRATPTTTTATAPPRPTGAAGSRPAPSCWSSRCSPGASARTPGRHGQDPALAQFTAVGVGVVALVAEQGLGAAAGSARASGDRRDAVDQGEGLGDVVDVGHGGDDLEWGAVSVADQMVLAARLPPVDRRRPVSAPPSSRGRGSRRRMLWTSPARRLRSARRAGSGAAGRRHRPSATAPDAASRSARSRTRVPGAAVAGRCRCGARTGCPASTAGPAPVAGREPSRARAAATARSTPTGHRPRSTAGYSHHLERPNRHTGHGQPGTFSKIVSRARRSPRRHPRSSTIVSASAMIWALCAFAFSRTDRCFAISFS